MNALLSHFTLYKSIFVIYNMICNKHHNSSKKSQKTCLVEDMKTCKIQSLEMPKNNVMKKMLNTFFSQIYKVLINGTKKNYKMFYVCWKVWAFFSNTHNWWKFTMLEQIVDIEKFIKCIHVSLDYNDCLVKCAMLFHTRVKKCMQQFLLTSHHSFNNIKLYVKIMKFTNVIHFTHTSLFGLHKMTLKLLQMTLLHSFMQHLIRKRKNLYNPYMKWKTHFTQSWLEIKIPQVKISKLMQMWIPIQCIITSIS